MNKTILVLSFVAATSMASKAAFISFITGGARGHQFVLSDGTTRVAAGNNVRVGYVTAPNDLSTFIEFGTTTIANPLSSALVGGFVNTKTGDQPSVAGIRNQQVVIWVYGQNGQQGAFTSAAWTVPVGLQPDIDASYDVLLGVASGGTPPAVSALTVPGFNPSQYQAPVSITVTTGTNPSGASYILGAPIPEPATSLFGALAAFGMLVRRRR